MTCGDCEQQYVTEVPLCSQHVRLPLWEVNYNYEPEIERMAGKCRSCPEHDRDQSYSVLGTQDSAGVLSA
jgi:hypothetical protein